MRGKVRRTYAKVYKARITPAHAGKREDLSHTYHKAKDHPRTCGEKEALQLVLG